MTNLSKIQLKEALKSKMERLGLSGNKISKLIGISNANVSHILNGKAIEEDRLISDKIWQKVYSWVYQSENDSWKSAETTGFKKVVTICRHVQKAGVSRAICDNSGGGKTHPLKAYANAVPNVFYIECEEYYTKKGFLRELMRVMGIKDNVSAIQDMADVVINHLNQINKPLILIDEADKLKDGVINLFKTLYNKTNSGILLSGTPYLKVRIAKGVRLEKQCYQEILSRVGGLFISLPKLTTKDVGLICEVNGVNDENLVTEAYNYADGDIRRVRQVVELHKENTLKNNSHVAH